MMVDQVRVPDLWLKRALAFSLLETGQKTFRLDGASLIGCIRGDGASVFSLNKMIAGDTMAGVKTDLYYFAATMEYLLLHGPESKFDRKRIMAFAKERGEALVLWPGPILGTFADFANGLLALMRDRADWSVAKDERDRATLGRVLRQAMSDALTDITEPEQKLRLLWGKTRNWALSPGGLERIIRQPESEVPEIPVNDFVQIVVPGAASPQWVFGFELRADDSAVLAPWAKVGGWFAPRAQPTTTPIALLPEFEEDDRNATAIEPGTFWIHLVGVDVPAGVNEPPAMPTGIAKLVDGAPRDWPAGYAQSIALITYVRRLHDARRKAEGRKERDRLYLEPLPGEEILIHSRASLYRAEYQVIAE